MCRRRACEVLYWPYMNQSISEMVKSCSTCKKYKMKQRSQPLQPQPVTNYPWEKVGVDICVFGKENFIVICDYYSNYPKVCRLSSIASESVINAMKYVFAGQGIPQVMYSDNGSQFTSDEFVNLLKVMISSMLLHLHDVCKLMS